MSKYESSTPERHRQQGPASVGCAVITVSDTRTLPDDRGGATVVEFLEGGGHHVVARTIVPDEPTELASAVEQYAKSEDVEAVLITGGTGIAPRDQSPEAIRGLLTKELPGYGELLRVLSYEEIGAAAMLSRALGGLIGKTVVLMMPGSTAAVRLAMDKLIVPELGHMVEEARK